MIDGERLKQLRRQKKISAEDLGAMIGVSRQQIHRYEMGQTDTTSNVLLKIADFFNVSTDYLLGRTTESGESSGAQFMWEFDIRYLIDRIPPQRLANLAKRFDVSVQIENSTLDVKELLASYPPAFVAKLMREFGQEISLINSGEL